MGDYVIDDSADEFVDFTGDEGNWWTSFFLHISFILSTINQCL